MYKISRELIEQRWGDAEATADALGVLLLTWNQAAYRYGAFDYTRLQIFLEANATILDEYRAMRLEDIAILTGGKLIAEELGKVGIEAEISGRAKHFYSIYDKMAKKGREFNEIFDLTAMRVIVERDGEEGTRDCYGGLGLIHSLWKPMPGRFKDYISTPKPNGYRSLHTSVIGPERQRIEVQIRTRDMDEVAERGVAAHWSYKQGVQNIDGRQYRWLRELLDILEQASGPEEFLEHTKLEMFQDQVFCFTPKGDLIALPRGATPVDFAYAVHSEVGDKCVGAKINGRLMPLRTRLANGDEVEIGTSKAQTP